MRIVLDQHMARLRDMLSANSRIFDDREEQETCEALRKFFSSEQPKPEIILDQDIIRLLELHVKKREKVKQVLKNKEGNISLSVDVISSGKADNKKGLEYMCLTAHFIDHEWILRRFVLDFSPIGGEEKDSPSDIILRCLRDWEIVDKIWTITMVNGILYDKMFEAVKNEISGALLINKLRRVNCCADTVKTVVQDAYESINDILVKIEDMQSFRDELSTWENKNSRRLDVAINRTEETRVFSGIRYEDRRKASDVFKVVDKIYELVSPLFGKGYQSANVFLCNLHEVLFYLKQIVVPSNHFMKGVAEKMLGTLNLYVVHSYFLLTTATVMDPRLKLKYLDFFLQKLKSNPSEIEKFLSGIIQSLYNDYAARYAMNENFSGRMLMHEFSLYTHSTSPALVSEFQSYLGEPVLDWSSDFSALTWWKVKGSSKYPILSSMARDILATPFTTAVGDDSLLIEQRKFDSCLASIKPNLANALMCIRSWLLDQNPALSSLLSQF